MLAPSYTARLRTNQQHGRLYVDEVPGLAFALARPATVAAADVVLTTQATLHAELLLPDVVAALCLKAYAYSGRLHPRDALDIWRLLEAAYRAGVRAGGWPSSATGKDASQILHRHFGRPSSKGTADATTATAQQARIRAQVAQVIA